MERHGLTNVYMKNNWLFPFPVILPYQTYIPAIANHSRDEKDPDCTDTSRFPYQALLRASMQAVNGAGSIQVFGDRISVPVDG
jgi:hypothetical protein